VHPLRPPLLPTGWAAPDRCQVPTNSYQSIPEPPTLKESVFVELVPGQKVVIDHVVPPKFRLISQFEAEGSRTRTTWRQIFESREVCEKVKGVAGPGNEDNLDRLAAEIAAMS
jgi:hypothetical protein